MSSLPSDPFRRPTLGTPRAPSPAGPASSGAGSESELLPTWDFPTPEAPVALPVEDDDVPVAAPVKPEEVPAGAIPEAIPVGEPVEAVEEPIVEAEVAQAEEAAPPVKPRELCPLCRSPRVGDAQFCFDCGLMFSAANPPIVEDAPAPPPVAAVAAEVPAARLADRYEVQEQVAVHGTVTRYHGLDHGMSGEPTPIIILQAPAEPAADSGNGERPENLEDIDLAEKPRRTDSHPTLRFPPAGIAVPTGWPDLAWERRLLEQALHSSLPRVLDAFTENGCDYLIEEGFATEQKLWDAWDDPQTTMGQRFEWLAEIAEGLERIHESGAILEGLRPDIIAITPHGRAVLTDLSGLLPLPLPPDAPIQGTLYTAPELMIGSADADARADLYSFGATIYALYLSRELTEMDFERPGVPKPFVIRFPDVHPVLGRIVMKTFTRERDWRFPTEEAVKEDKTGFGELIRTLRTAGRSMANVRLDIASWTSTGVVRTGNEDAFALMHAVSSRQDEMGEWALVILCDGMGGYEAGEVAAAMAIDQLRQHLLKQNVFAGLSGEAAHADDTFDVRACRELFANALRDTNKHVFTMSRSPGKGKRGMGCTAEVVYVDGRRVVVGHVGDSRTYHYRYADGRLVQLTRDQTLVNRLVELGQLSEAEALNHPRKNELQQAIGGQPFVDPGLYDAELRPGDWIIVCSDGLTNHIDDETLRSDFLQRADSAEMCARRLVNYVNFRGATDNCTVVAIRAT